MLVPIVPFTVESPKKVKIPCPSCAVFIVEVIFEPSDKIKLELFVVPLSKTVFVA